MGAVASRAIRRPLRAILFRFVSTFTLFPLLCCASGCGAAVVGAAIASSQSSDDESNSPATVRVFEAREGQSDPDLPVEEYFEGLIAFEFFLSDAESNPTTVVPEFSASGDAEFRSATPGPGVATKNLETSLDGVVHLFVWDSPVDLPDANGQQVRFRLRAGVAVSELDRAIVVNNTSAPVIENVRVTSDPTISTPGEKLSGSLRVHFRLKDEEADEARVRMFFQPDDGNPALQMTIASPGDAVASREIPFETSVDGLDFTVAWESNREVLGKENGSIILKVYDSKIGDPAAIVVPQIDNTVPLLNLITPTATQAGRVVLQYRVSDQGSDPFEVVSATFSLFGGVEGSMKDATEAEGPPSEGLGRENGLKPTPQGQPHVFVWNAFRDVDDVLADLGFPGSDRVVLELVIRDLATGVEVTQRTNEFTVNQAFISTYAGGGARDLAQAENARLEFPKDVAFDAEGNLYIADFGNFRVRKVNARTGVIDTFAGTGVIGAAQNPSDVFVEGPGKTVDLLGPVALAVVDDRRVSGETDDGTALAELYFADANGEGGEALVFHTVRRADLRTGVVETVAGGGSDFSSEFIPATSARLFFPAGLAVDPATDSLFVAESGLNRIRRVDLVDGTIVTIADGLGFSTPGESASELLRVRGLVVDADGGLLFAETAAHRVRRLDLSSLNIITVAGSGLADASGDGGPALDAGLSRPFGLAVDSSGALFISHFEPLDADRERGRVRRVDPDPENRVISTVVGGGDEFCDGCPATTVRLPDIGGLALDPSEDLHLTTACRTLVLDDAGFLSTFAGEAFLCLGIDVVDGEVVAAQLEDPATEVQKLFTSADIAADGTVFVTTESVLSGIDPRTGTMSLIQNFQLVDGSPQVFAVAVGAGEVFVAGTTDGGDGFPSTRVFRVDPSNPESSPTVVAGGGGVPFGSGIPATEARLFGVSIGGGLSIDGEGNPLIAESTRVSRVGAGTIETLLESAEIVVNLGAQLQQIFGLDAPPLTVFITSVEPGDAGETFVMAQVVDFTDIVGSALVLFLEESRQFLLIFVFFPSEGPEPLLGMKFVSPRQTLYVCDGSTRTVQKISFAAGVVFPVAGNGGFGFAGDGGPPDQAILSLPLDVAVDALGNVYVVDGFSGRVRRFFDGEQ